MTNLCPACGAFEVDPQSGWRLKCGCTINTCSGNCAESLTEEQQARVLKADPCLYKSFVALR